MTHYIIIEPESTEAPVMVFQPENGCYVIGRNPEITDIHLADPTVSRRHALLFVESDRILIQDQNSTKGVVIDGSRINPQKSVAISPNNNVMIGSYLLYVTNELEGGVTATATAPKVYASASGEELIKLRGKIADLRGNTIIGLPAPSNPAPQKETLEGNVGSTLVGDVNSTMTGEDIGSTFTGGEAPQVAAASDTPGTEVEEARYTFPPMPKVSPEQQDTVDRFIYRRIKPLFDQLMQERTGGNKNAESIRDMSEEILRSILKQQEKHIPAGLSQDDIIKLSLAAFMDYGPLQGLLGDETVTEIMINSANDIFIEQSGNLFKSHLRFWNEQELRRVIEKMVMVTNRRIDEQQPYQDTRLEDGSRVNIIIRPLALSGDSVTIRKFPNKRLMVNDLVNFGSMDDSMARFLQMIVNYRANVIVSGGTGSGKTTLLNVLSSFIPDHERLVSIEDAAELRLNQPNKVTLEARPKSLEGGGAVTIRDLVINALRMRPDRIIVGECRGGEAMDMLQAMNTGHDGSLTTLHANNARDAIARLETMCLMSGMELPAKAIRSQIVSAVHFIVQQSRLPGGARKVVSVNEVLGLEGDQVVMQEIFHYTRTGIDENGKVQGYFEPTGVIPQYVSNLRNDKVDFPIDMFNA